jgi:ribosomal protein S18 acetylase RimI-like enzyme
MASYRFCRPDDIPLLVAAVNRCYDVHFPAAAPLTVDDFRLEMKQLQLWPSNSMVASGGDGPVAVMLGTKRPREVLVRRIGVAPGYQRQGHGRHLLTSLAQKLAVLGPPRLVAEVPAALEGACGFFAAAGWREEAQLTDYVRAVASRRPPPELLAPVTVSELDTLGLLPDRAGLPWQRQAESLRASAHELSGLAVVGGEEWAAWALFRDAGAGVEVLALGWGAGQPAQAALAPLLDGIQTGRPGPLRLAALLPGELPDGVLAGLGFAPFATTHRFAAEVLVA